MGIHHHEKCCKGGAYLHILLKVCDVGISLVRSGRFPKEVTPEVISNGKAEIYSVGREKGSVFLFEDRSRWLLQLK